VCDDYGGATDNHRYHGGSQHETQSSEKNQQASNRLRNQVAAWSAAWPSVLELAQPGWVLLLELALQVLQPVTVTVIQH
jgi:hypothetical protein